jgi:hypothetical protein
MSVILRGVLHQMAQLAELFGDIGIHDNRYTSGSPFHSLVQAPAAKRILAIAAGRALRLRVAAIRA